MRMHDMKAVDYLLAISRYSKYTNNYQKKGKS